jgi:hypothetical protein
MTRPDVRKGKNMVVVMHMLYDYASKARQMHPLERTYVQRNETRVLPWREPEYNAPRQIERDLLRSGRTVHGAGDTNEKRRSAAVYRSC